MSNPSKSTIRQEILLALAYPFFLIVITFMCFVPRKIRIIISKNIAKATWFISKRSYNISIKNLQRAYPEKSINEIKDMGKEVMQNFIKTVIDFFSSAILISKQRFFSMVEIEGEENLRKAYERGKGVICMIPHLSAWELSAVTPPMLGYKTYAASKPIKGLLFNWTFVYLRARRGMINFARGGSYNKLLKVLNDGNCLIIMTDQDSKRIKGEFIPFFKTPAYTPIGISRLALDTEATIVPMAMTRKSNDLFKFTIYPELTTIRTGDYYADCTANTIAQSEEYERIIRQTPTQWIWMHKRWNTTPETLNRYLTLREKEKAVKGKK